MVSCNTSNLPTFFSNRGESWVDVCVANQNVIKYMDKCETVDDITASDHRYIIWSLTNTPAQHTDNNIKKHTEWNTFKNYFSNLCATQQINNITDIDILAEHLNSCIIQAYNHSTTYTQVKTKNAHWWNNELFILRQKTRKLQKRYRSETDPERKKEEMNILGVLITTKQK
ncbi:uncharacterized protein LOC111628636 [Centruroides sculpturatus]|uniref:uncharacterized protein LOC111628636 n=1 Tax=Centruroides sculpturatus TaxID=218467 RepID=UPI000C6E6A21|nr:uncharacterized protein LOC111628636 [Centruroides sculpturatus]